MAAAARLPRRSGVVYRAFGAADALDTAMALAALARRKGLILLIGADAALAARCRADGVHLPERLAGQTRRLQAQHPAWIVTTAAHSPRALARAAQAGADAAVLSVVFPSRSPSAGLAIGPVRFAALARVSRLPVIALGGVSSRTAPRLLDSGAVGVAAVNGLI
ncbi:thiamine phosphate synthase [soil metagenome]